MTRKLIKPRAFREPIHPDAPGFNPALHKDLVTEINEALPTWVTDIVGGPDAAPDTHQLRLSVSGVLEYWTGEAWRQAGGGGGSGTSAPDAERLPTATPQIAHALARVRADGQGWEPLLTPLSEPVTPERTGQVLGTDENGNWVMRRALAPTRRTLELPAQPVAPRAKVTRTGQYGGYVYGLEVEVQTPSTGDVVVRIYEDEAKTRCVYDGLFTPEARRDRAQAWFFISDGGGTAYVEVENLSGGTWPVAVTIRGVQLA